MADADPARPPVAELAAMQAAFDRLHAASRAAPPATAEERRDRLDRLKAMVKARSVRFTEAIAADFGTRATIETELMELVPTLSAVDHARKNLERWMRPEKRHVGLNFLPGRAFVQYQPLGVIGIISPWNYPLNLALSPLVDALAAGNRAMIKPSELTPAFSAALAEAVAEAFEGDEVAVATGGVEVGKAFASLAFDHLLFTGSTAVGREVYKAAAANLTPVTLELGGKSPVILADDYPLAKAARSIAFGKFLNAGQTCIAPDYVLVPEAKAEALAEALLSEAKRSYPDPARDPDYSGIISERHRARLAEAIDMARAAGAKVMTSGEVGAGKIAPTVVIGAPEETILASEEIFGPLLPVIGYKRLEDAIAFVNARDRPLALYCFARDAGVQAHVLRSTVSGGATVNGTLLHIAQESLPFGGVGPSGIGAYHGLEGFKRFSHARGVYKAGPFVAFEKLGPPWGGLARRMAKAMLGR